MNGQLITAFGSGCVVTLVVVLGVVTISQNSHALKLSDISKLNRLTDSIESEYMGEFTERDIRDGVMHGALSNLDIYSDYMSYDDMNKTINGDNEFAGIGTRMYYNAYSEVIKIVSVYKDSPAEKAGLQAGDIITEIDGTPTSFLKFSEAIEMVRGERGSIVTLKVLREEDEFEVDIIREDMYLPSVEWHIFEDGVGYLKLSEFNSSVEMDMIKALENLSSCEDVVFDLRGNSGGTVDDLVEIVGMMYPDSLLCTMTSTNGIKQEYRSASGSGIDFNLIVLCDSSTASCGEILVQFLMDRGIKSVGERTYGKGVAQSLIEIGSEDFIKLTTSKIYSPKGVCWNETGIEPDFVIESNGEFDIEKDNVIHLARLLLLSGDDKD